MMKFLCPLFAGLLFQSSLLALGVETLPPNELPRTTDAFKNAKKKGKKVEEVPAPVVKPKAPSTDPLQPVAYGPLVDRMEYEVTYPNDEMAMRNIMSPAPLPNNPQIYPFMLTIPMEGGEILAPKAMEILLSQH